MSEDKLKMRFVDPATIRANDIIAYRNILCRVDFTSKHFGRKLITISASDIEGKPYMFSCDSRKPILKCTDKRIILL